MNNPKLLLLLSLCLLMTGVLASCHYTELTIGNPVLPTPTAYPESLGPQAAHVCESAFSVVNPVITALAERPVLLVEEFAGSWRASRLDTFADSVEPWRARAPLIESLVPEAVEDVKTLACIRDVGNGQREIRLVSWPEGTIVGKQNLRYYGVGGFSYSSAYPGAVWREIPSPVFYTWLTSVFDHNHVLVSESEIRDIAFSPDGSTLASLTASLDGREITLWDTTTWQTISSLHLSGNDGHNLAFSPDGQRVVVGRSGGIALLDVVTGERLSWLVAQRDSELPHASSTFALSPNGQSLATGVADLVYLLDVRSGNVLRILASNHGSVGNVAFAPNGETLAAATSDGSVHIWHLANEQELPAWTVTVTPDQVLSSSRISPGIAFSPDSLLLASSSDGEVKLWDVRTGGELHTLSNTPSWLFQSVAFAPDSLSLAAVSQQSVRVWDVASGQQLHDFVAEYGGIGFRKVAFSPDGTVLASVGGHIIGLREIAGRN
jgi:DNA-binding beta-propeller fold protein YncE